MFILTTADLSAYKFFGQPPQFYYDPIQKGRL